MPGIEDIRRDTEARLNAIIASSREQLRREMDMIVGAWPPELTRDLADMPAPSAISLNEIAGVFDAPLAQKYGAKTPPPALDPYPAASALSAQSIAGMESHFEQIIGAARGSLPASAAAIPQGFAEACQQMDDYLQKTLLHDPGPATHAGAKLGPNVVFPPSGKAYLDEIAAWLGCAAPEREMMHSGPPSVYIPGYGNLMNPDVQGARINTKTAWAGEARRITITRALAAHRLGRGFILEFTPLGRLIGQNGWWQLPVRKSMGMETAPDAMARYAVWRDASRFTRSGWRSFITAEMNHRFGEMPASPPSLQELFEALKLVMGTIDFDVLNNPLMRLVVFIFKKVLEVTNDKQDARRLLWAMKALNGVNARFGKLFQNTDDEDLGAAIGRMLINRLEANTGSTANIPHGVAMALGPDNLFLANMPADRAATLVASEPLMHPDARLAMLCALRHKPVNTPETMVQAAKSQWEMK